VGASAQTRTEGKDFRTIFTVKTKIPSKLTTRDSYHQRPPTTSPPLFLLQHNRRFYKLRPRRKRRGGRGYNCCNQSPHQVNHLDRKGILWGGSGNNGGLTVYSSQEGKNKKRLSTQEQINVFETGGVKATQRGIRKGAVHLHQSGRTDMVKVIRGGKSLPSRWVAVLPKGWWRITKLSTVRRKRGKGACQQT